jgi:uncharacterized protein YjbI with pentapeptide repeats
LREVRLEGANMRDMDLRGANLEGARLEGVNLGGAHLDRARFVNARLEGSNLDSAGLQSADFTSAEVIAANMRNADLRNASFQNAIVCSDDTEVIEDGGTRTVRIGKTDCVRLDGADLHGANFRGAQHCVWLDDRRNQPQCTPATASMLETYGRANLSGATGP